MFQLSVSACFEAPISDSVILRSGVTVLIYFISSDACVYVCFFFWMNEWMNADENRIECFRCLSKSTHRWSVQHVFLFIIMDFFQVFCFAGGCRGNQAILLRGFGGELKGWEDSEIQCLSPGWDLSNFTVAENSYSLFGYLFVFTTVTTKSLSI